MCANACGSNIYNDPAHAVCERPGISDAAISREPVILVREVRVIP